MTPTGLSIVLGSAAYFALHSLLASIRVKRYVWQHLPGLLPAYRLLYNLLAVVLLVPLLWLVYRDPGPLLWAWQGAWRWVSLALTLLAAAGFLLATRAYDMDLFLGLRQWRERQHLTAVPEELHISTFHRFVRHPWYFLGLLFLWSRDQYLNQTIFYAMITVYLVIGSRLEERKLIHQYGEAYRRYRRRVPGLVPLPWRWLRAQQARELVRMAADEESGLNLLKGREGSPG